MRRFTFSCTILLGLVLSACSGFGAPAPTPEPWTPPATATPAAEASPAATAAPTSIPLQSYTVSRGVVENRINMQGEVVEARARDLTFTFDGIVNTIAVGTDAIFSKGDLLAEQEMGELSDQLDQAQAILRQEQEAYDTAIAERQRPGRRAEIQIEAPRATLSLLTRPPNVLDITRAEADIRQAEANLARVRKDSSAIKNRAEQQLRQAQRQLIYAQNDFSAAVDAVERSSGSDRAAAEARLAEANDRLRAAEDAVANAQIEYDTAFGNEIAAIQTAEAQLEIAKTNLDRLRQGATPQQITDARRNVDIATLALQEARQNVRPDPQLKARVDTAQLTVNRIIEQMEVRRIYAPFDGEVVAVNVVPNTPVRAGDVVIVVIDSSIAASALEVRTSNSDDRLADAIRIGLPAELSFNRLAGQTIAGTIVQAPLISNLGVINPTIRVRFNNESLGLAVGDAATVTLLLARKDNALWLPAEALGFDARYYVLVPEGEIATRVNIEVGIVGSERIEILSGLREGDTVVAPR